MHGRSVSMCPFCKHYFTDSVLYLKHMADNHPQKSETSLESNQVFKLSPPNATFQQFSINWIFITQLPELLSKKSRAKKSNERKTNHEVGMISVLSTIIHASKRDLLSNSKSKSVKSDKASDLHIVIAQFLTKFIRFQPHNISFYQDSTGWISG